MRRDILFHQSDVLIHTPMIFPIPVHIAVIRMLGFLSRFPLVRPYCLENRGSLLQPVTEPADTSEQFNYPYRFRHSGLSICWTILQGSIGTATILAVQKLRRPLSLASCPLAAVSSLSHDSHGRAVQGSLHGENRTRDSLTRPVEQYGSLPVSHYCRR